jgi:hypothetical protein
MANKSPSKYQQFRQGIYFPQNPEKCLNKEAICYRSHLEFKLMLLCDRNPMVKSWGSEIVVVPYIHPLKSIRVGKDVMARYYVDFLIVFNKEDGKDETVLVEVKPKKQTIPPTKSKNKKLSTVLHENATFSINQAKWKAAEEFARQKNYRFYIVNEETIKQLEKI